MTTKPIALAILLALPLAAVAPVHALTADEALAVSDMTRLSTQRIAVQQAIIALASEGSDTEGDGYVESPAMLTGSGGPTGGGLVPATSAAPKDDSYNVKLGYCAWDNGATNTSTGRITGVTSGYNAPVLAVVSAGLDNVFNTSCANLASGGTGVQGDDFAISYTGTQIQQGNSGTLYFGDPVSDLMILNGLDKALQKDGMVRLTKDTGILYRFDGPSQTWKIVTAAGIPFKPGTGTGTPYYFSDNMPVVIGADPSAQPGNKLTVNDPAAGIPLGLRTQGQFNGMQLQNPATGTDGFVGYDNTANRLVLNAQRTGGQVDLQINGTSYLRVANNGEVIASGKLTAMVGAPVALTSGGYFFKIGGETVQNLVMDSSSLQSRNNGVAATLNLNPLGGRVNANGPLAANAGSPVSLANGGYFFRVGGEAGQNVAMDFNAIQARNAGATSTLNLNPLGGMVTVPTLTSKGHIYLNNGTAEMMIVMGNSGGYWYGNTNFAGWYKEGGGHMHINAATGDFFTNGSIQAAKSLTIGQGGTYAPGSIYSDVNWGMILRAANGAPTSGKAFSFRSAADAELFSISTSGQATYNSAALGTTAGNETQMMSLNHLSGNANQLRFLGFRKTDGTGWDTSSNRMQMRVDVSDMGYVEFNPAGANGGIAFGTGLTNAGPGAVPERMRITAQGNVGIATTNPVATLTVNKTGLIGGANQANYDIGAGMIAAGKSVYSYERMCVGNSNHDCGGVSGTVITHGRLAFNPNSGRATEFTQGGNDSLRLTTPHGFVDIGAQNTGYIHYFSGDGRPHWFANPVESNAEFRIHNSGTFTNLLESKFIVPHIDTRVV